MKSEYALKELICVWLLDWTGLMRFTNIPHIGIYALLLILASFILNLFILIEFYKKQVMRKYIYVFVMMLIVSSCGSRSQRLMRSVDGAIDDYNNGDSTSLIILIILGVLLGVLWLSKRKDD